MRPLFIYDCCKFPQLRHIMTILKYYQSMLVTAHTQDDPANQVRLQYPALPNHGIFKSGQHRNHDLRIMVDEII